ncbi:unnamed protein product [Lymnaea stagnalis]|uniref:Uncharacterized protein n=1 Tax=Lymnaea stagnalis TaxID=6523 RepID=A0AAV2I2N0_LYMST
MNSVVHPSILGTMWMAHNKEPITTLWKSPLFALVLVASFLQSSDQMMSRLSDVKHGWFGHQYTLICFKANPPWPRCFNLRNMSDESIIERAGLSKNAMLTTELTVTFSAPKEKVDICGKQQLLDEVMPFTLERGAPIKYSLLEKGAEIYRRQPTVSWDAKPELLYTLIFWDAGLFKVRGWFYNIRLSGGDLKGFINIPYYPPANPISTVNPILILLLQQRASVTSMTSDIMQTCVAYGPTPEAADKCRSKLIEWMQNGLTLIGLQAYYTSRTSMYERYRACTEGYMCCTTCLEIFNSFGAGNLPEMLFLGKIKMKLDFYVNLRFTGVTNQIVETECCELPLPLPMFEFRPRPGDNARVASIGQISPSLSNVLMTLEVAGSSAAFQDQGTLYSVIVVDVHGSTFKRYPVVLNTFGNFKYPAMNSTLVTESVAYRPPNPANASQVYILLFSHQRQYKGITNDGPCYSPLTQMATDCSDFDRLPRDFVLRSVSWFFAGFDLFKVNYDHTVRKLDCENYFISSVKCPETDFRVELDLPYVIGRVD